MPGTRWQARIDVEAGSPRVADWVYRALAPEAEREVPRARAKLSPPTGSTLRLEITADDSGALRAGANTFLGWVRVALAAAEVATRSPS
jgi:tRNA threonylcarbamoyladenosine modification (KEOPS) complex  Pcc1 subunit